MDNLSVGNARSLVNTVEQRKQHFSSAIHNLNWLAVTLVAGVWAFFLDGFLKHSPFVNPNISAENAQSFAFSYIIMAAGISSVILLLWRLYVRYLDNQISAIYPEILRYEKCLGVSADDGTSKYLAESNKILKAVLPELGQTQQIELVRQLVHDGHIGRRGTQFIGYLVIIAFILFVGSITVDVIFLNVNQQFEGLFNICDINRLPIILSKLLGYLAIIVSFFSHLYITFFKFQRGLRDKHVDKILPSLKSVEQAKKS